MCNIKSQILNLLVEIQIAVQVDHEQVRWFAYNKSWLVTCITQAINNQYTKEEIKKAYDAYYWQHPEHQGILRP